MRTQITENQVRRLRAKFNGDDRDYYRPDNGAPERGVLPRRWARVEGGRLIAGIGDGNGRVVAENWAEAEDYITNA